MFSFVARLAGAGLAGATLLRAGLWVVDEIAEISDRIQVEVAVHARRQGVLETQLCTVPARVEAALAQLLPSLRDRLVVLTDISDCVAAVRRVTDSSDNDIGRTERVAALWDEIKLRSATRAVAAAAVAAALSSILHIVMLLAARLAETPAAVAAASAAAATPTTQTDKEDTKEATAVVMLAEMLLGNELTATVALIRAGVAAVAGSRRWSVTNASPEFEGGVCAADVQLLLRQAWAAVETSSPAGAYRLVHTLLPRDASPTRARLERDFGVGSAGGCSEEASYLVRATLDVVRSPAFAPVLRGALDVTFDALDVEVDACVFDRVGGDAPRVPVAVAIVRLRAAVDELLLGSAADSQSVLPSVDQCQGPSSPHSASARVAPLSSALARHHDAGELGRILMFQAKLY